MEGFPIVSLVIVVLVVLGLYSGFRWSGHRPNLVRMLKLLVFLATPTGVLFWMALEVAEDGGSPFWLMAAGMTWLMFVGMLGSIRWGLGVLDPSYRLRWVLANIGIWMLFFPSMVFPWLLIPWAVAAVVHFRIMDGLSRVTVAGVSPCFSKQIEGMRVEKLIGILDETDWPQLMAEHARMKAMGKPSQIPCLQINFRSNNWLAILEPLHAPYRGRCRYSRPNGKLWGWIPCRMPVSLEFEGLSRETLDEVIRVWQPSDPAWIELISKRCVVTKMQEGLANR